VTRALLHYEDFAVGQVHRLGTHTLAKDEMIAYAREYDSQPQHLDEEAARTSLLGGLAASGWFLGALAMRMIVDNLFIRAASMGSPGIEELQWRKPVYAGDTVMLEGEVIAARASSRRDRGFIKFRFSFYRTKPGGREVVMSYVSSVMFARRGAGPHALTGSA
jgi:acyl dehydratase